MATSMAAVFGGIACAAPPERVVAAGTTATGGGWRASLFVARPPVKDDSLALRESTTVGARLSRPLAGNARLSVDIFNVFDQRTGGIDHFAATRSNFELGVADNYLFHPAERRGVRLGLRFTFR